MDALFERTAMLVGQEGIDRLQRAHVAVFGIGGVGGHCTDALARAGVGTLTIVDHDTVSASNLNRQIIAFRSTIGRRKTEVMQERLLDINPALTVHALPVFVDRGTMERFDFSAFDYVVDAVDTVTAKLLLIERCRDAGTPVLSCMGTGNKLMTEPFRIADISETSVCPLARVMRLECRKRGITRLKVLYSPEPPIRPQPGSGGCAPGRRQTPGSIAFAPACAGLTIAGQVIRELLSGCGQ